MTYTSTQINRSTSRQYILTLHRVKHSPGQRSAVPSSCHQDLILAMSIHTHTHMSALAFELRSAIVVWTPTRSPGGLSWPGLVLDPLQRHYSRECTADSFEVGGRHHSYWGHRLSLPSGRLPKKHKEIIESFSDRSDGCHQVRSEISLWPMTYRTITNNPLMKPHLNSVDPDLLLEKWNGFFPDPFQT